MQQENLYYMAYEERYQKTYAAGAEYWGHFPDDQELISILTEWVEKNDLKGKNIIEFACGEGASGVILSKLGCIYYGVDIAPSAIKKAKLDLQEFPNAEVCLHDMVNQSIDGKFDAALDIMGFHMLVTDVDRKKYLSNVINSLQPDSPMLFYRESFRSDEIDKKVETYEDWLRISGSDYETPEQRFVEHDNKKFEVWVPLVPARAKSKDGYVKELEQAGFFVDDFIEMDESYKITNSATIYVHKL